MTKKIQIGDKIKLQYQGETYEFTVTKENKKSWGIHYFRKDPKLILNLCLHKITGKVY